MFIFIIIPVKSTFHFILTPFVEPFYGEQLDSLVSNLLLYTLSLGVPEIMKKTKIEYPVNSTPVSIALIWVRCFSVIIWFQLSPI